MKRIFPFFFLIIFLIQSYSNQIYQSYIKAYGEGPRGKYFVGFDVIEYSKEDTVRLAKEEIIEFLSGMIYGYSFVYRIENKLDHTKGYFDLKPIYRISPGDKNIQLNQVEEDQIKVGILAVYRLLDNQKNYIMGFQSSLAKMSVGEARTSFFKKWETRLAVYKEALRNAVLNEAKNRLKARPLYIRGRLLLKENPHFRIISGEWAVRVEAHIIIKDIEYQDVY